MAYAVVLCVWHVCVHACVHACVCLGARVCLSSCVSVCVCVSTCICPCVCVQVSVNHIAARLPFSRQSLYVDDTGSMYVIQTPGGVSIQWYHSTGIMVLQYTAPSNASTPTRGLCGEHTHARMCLYAHAHTNEECMNTQRSCMRTRDVHLHHWGRCDAHLDALPTMRYIKDT